MPINPFEINPSEKILGVSPKQIEQVPLRRVEEEQGTAMPSTGYVFKEKVKKTWETSPLAFAAKSAYKSATGQQQPVSREDFKRRYPMLKDSDYKENMSDFTASELAKKRYAEIKDSALSSAAGLGTVSNFGLDMIAGLASPESLAITVGTMGVGAGVGTLLRNSARATQLLASSKVLSPVAKAYASKGIKAALVRNTFESAVSSAVIDAPTLGYAVGAGYMDKSEAAMVAGTSFVGGTILGTGADYALSKAFGSSLARKMTSAAPNATKATFNKLKNLFRKGNTETATILAIQASESGSFPATVARSVMDKTANYAHVPREAGTFVVTDAKGKIVPFGDTGMPTAFFDYQAAYTAKKLAGDDFSIVKIEDLQDAPIFKDDLIDGLIEKHPGLEKYRGKTVSEALEEMASNEDARSIEGFRMSMQEKQMVYIPDEESRMGELHFDEDDLTSMDAMTIADDPSLEYKSSRLAVEEKDGKFVVQNGEHILDEDITRILEGDKIIAEDPMRHSYFEDEPEPDIADARMADKEELDALLKADRSYSDISNDVTDIFKRLDEEPNAINIEDVTLDAEARSIIEDPEAFLRDGLDDVVKESGLDIDEAELRKSVIETIFNRDAPKPETKGFIKHMIATVLCSTRRK